MRSVSKYQKGEPAQTTSKDYIHTEMFKYDLKRIVFREILLCNKTINLEMYIKQLTKITKCSVRKTTSFNKSKKYCVTHWQCESTHMFSFQAKKYWSFVGMFCQIPNFSYILPFILFFCKICSMSNI